MMQFAFFRLVTWALLCFLPIITTHGQTITCETDRECCCQSNLTASSTISCNGMESCTDVDLIWSESSDTQCNGAFSCFNSGIIHGTNVECQGLYSCSNTKNDGYIETTSAYARCHGEKSCSNSTIKLNGWSSMTAYGDESLANSIVYVDSSIFYWDIYGYQAAKNTRFIINSTSSLWNVFNFNGKQSGNGAFVYCGNNQQCYFNCQSDSCNNLTAICDNCHTLSVICTNAESSDFCDGVDS